MDKKKLLWVGDAGCSTGFARVTHAVLDRLADRYDIAVLGINYNGFPHSKPYRIYPAYSPGDFVGLQRIAEVYEREQPDATVLFQDFWNIAGYIQELPELKGLVAYYPVDAPNVKPGWAAYLATCAVAATYTQFAAEESAKAVQTAVDEVRTHADRFSRGSVTSVPAPSSKGLLPIPYYRLKELSRPEGFKVIPHGVDTSAFWEMDQTMARSLLGLPESGFIVLNVNRNQPRKRLDLCIRGFSEFAKDRKDAYLVLHCWGASKGKDLKAVEWDLGQLALHYGVSDKVILLHESKPELTDADLNALYNAADVVVNTSGGEGWGLPAFEAASVGKPLVLPDWSATREVWKDAALLTPIRSVYHELQGINTEQAAIDTDDFARQLELLYFNPELAHTIGEDCRQVTRRPEYSWDTIANTFDAAIRFAAEKGTLKARAVPL